jgi:hypothetical protein
MKEIWKDIKGYIGNYQVSNLGRIRSLNRKSWNGTGWFIKKGQIIKLQKSNSNYSCVLLWNNNKRKNFWVHKLVALHFIPNPEDKPEVNHKDGNKQNNNINNLEWCTRSENRSHAWKNGLFSENHREYIRRLGKYKRSEETLNKLRESLREYYSKLTLEEKRRKPLSEEAKKKLSESHKGSKNPMSRENIEKRRLLKLCAE